MTRSLLMGRHNWRLRGQHESGADVGIATNGISLRGEFRTSAVCAASLGGNTKVVSARLNSAAMACICPADSPSAFRTTASGLPTNWVPVKTSTV
jgi:hypothetical protein